MRFTLIIGGLFCLGSCDHVEAGTPGDELRRDPKPLLAPGDVDAKGEAAPSPLHSGPPDLPTATAAPPPAPEPLAPDPYADWQTWCEPQWAEVACETTADCESVDHPSPRSLTCMTPYWARKFEGKPKFCVAGYARPGELAYEKEWLSTFLQEQYFEQKHCEFDGRPIHEESWRCQQDPKRHAAVALHRYLWMVMMRESSARPWKRHSLAADEKANKSTWATRSKKYGWDVDTSEGDGRITMSRVSNDSNKYYGSRRRWMGLGYFGQNSPLWVHRWSVDAPPEILCRRVESVETYLRKARSVLRKWESGVRCNGTKHVNAEPTWADVHRAVSSGKMCPSSSGTSATANLTKRAGQVGLDINHRVTRASFGTPIPIEGQNERAAELRGLVNAQMADSDHSQGEEAKE